MPLQEFDFCWNKVANVQEQLEKLIGKNYFLNLSAKEAYKAYVRAYDSHSLKNIFDINTLDLVSVAKSFGFHAPPFVDLPMSSGRKSSTTKGRRPDAGGRGSSSNFGRRSGANYVPVGMSGKKAAKSVVFRAVPMHKKTDKRQFSR